MLFYFIVFFGLGVFVGYKFPQQVDQAVQSSKSLFNDLKDKITKKPS